MTYFCKPSIFWRTVVSGLNKFPASNSFPVANPPLLHCNHFGESLEAIEHMEHLGYCITFEMLDQFSASLPTENTTLGNIPGQMK